jgi:hypothetical protein
MGMDNISTIFEVLQGFLLYDYACHSLSVPIIIQVLFYFILTIHFVTNHKIC